MNITSFFKRLGAPLNNHVWSWGAVRDDGTVFLRVWQDKKRMVNGKPYIMVTHRDKHAHEEHNLGYEERNRHVQLIKDGAPCYMVMCLAKDPDAVPRDIKSFNQDDLFVGGELVELDGDYWLGYTARVPVIEVLQ